MPDNDPVRDLIYELGLVPGTKDKDGRVELARYINELLNNDFSRLISVLYRMDVNETKLRRLLNDNPATDAGSLIADLMIERQLERIKSRKETNKSGSVSSESDPDENEKW